MIAREAVADAANVGVLNIEESENTIAVKQEAQTILACNKVSLSVPERLDKLHARSD